MIFSTNALRRILVGRRLFSATLLALLLSNETFGSTGNIEFFQIGNGASVMQAPEGEFAATNHIVTSVPTTFAGPNLNAILGANTFYNQGLTGSNTAVANIEAGHIWNGHETLGHVTQFDHHPTAWDDLSTVGDQQGDLIDRHATWVGSFIGGRLGGSFPGEYQRGIAYGADLQSGAITTEWFSPAYSLGFNLTVDSFNHPYDAQFGSADVINSSWGFTDPTGASFLAQLGDALANQNPGTTWVVSAGNDGNAPNTVGSPGAGYNSVTVGALQNDGSNNYDSIADFSSRAPQDWSGGGFGCSACRAAVDIAAPGTDLTGAFYGGTTGGNNPSLADSMNIAGNNLYSGGLAGTSFASPIVAGAAALLDDASYADTNLSANSSSRDARVIKAVLQNSADKIPGWDNGQTNNAGVIETIQALDYSSGTGALNIDQSYSQYVTAFTQDVPGTPSGNQGQVGATGWDYGSVIAGTDNIYEIGQPLEGGSEFTVTLAWFRQRTGNVQVGITDAAQADLDLIIRDTLTNQVVAQSISGLNVSEHLHFTIPSTSMYQIEVNLFGAIFGNVPQEEYGLAWYGTAVPEPSSVILALLSCVLLSRRRES